MAGAGYKLFATGDVLTAAQVNTYLMQQTVMVFASSAARTTALSGVLAEGMVSYLQDTNTLEVYDGSAWVGATGDITGLTAGTGISISSATGPVPTVAIDTATTVDKTTAQTLTNKTLTSPVLTTPSISNIEAKGDILVGTADNTLGVITAGNNGETIVADSSTSTGLRYTAGNPIPNPVINSCFDIWQRGTSISGAGVYPYTADRWTAVRAGYAAGSTISRQATNDTTNLPNVQYCARVQRDSGNTSTAYIEIASTFESANSIPFAGKTVTFSFYARKGANYSEANSIVAASLVSGTGTDQFYTSFTSATVVATTNASLTTTWQRFTVTGTMSSAAKQLDVSFTYTPQGTAGAADYFEVTGVQVDIGSVALPVRRTGATIQGETSACQRYYFRITKNDGIIGHMYKYLTTDGMGFVELPVSMRVVPTSMDSLNVQFQQTNLTNNAISGPTINSGYSTNKIAAFTFGQTGLANGTQGYAALTSSGYVAFSAEM